MSRLQRALRQTRPPGIYRFVSDASVEFLQREAEREGWQFYFLDGTKIRDKKTYLQAIARALKFPDYFGKNWDALNDCLTDLEWTRGAGYIVLLQSPERFMKTSPEDWDVAMDIFSTAIQFWREQNIPFYVLLRGTVPETFPPL